MDIKLGLKEAIRFMLLPVISDKEEKYINSTLEILQNDHIEKGSSVEFIHLKYEIWNTTMI